MSAAAQQTIIDWFDDVYRRKGSRYLRPVEAYLIFAELLGLRREDKLLDVACGTGVMLRAAAAYTPQLYGIDISAVAVAQARRNVDGAAVAVGNAEELPYETASFDCITCLGSLERMLSAGRALDEMRRVGKPAARYCFLVRNSNTFSWRSFSKLAARDRTLSHASADSLDNWTSLFADHGFSVLDVLPDQYPLHNRRRWATLALGRIDYRRPLRPSAPLTRANEFIFLLRKAA